MFCDDGIMFLIISLTPSLGCHTDLEQSDRQLQAL